MSDDKIGKPHFPFSYLFFSVSHVFVSFMTLRTSPKKLNNLYGIPLNLIFFSKNTL